MRLTAAERRRFAAEAREMLRQMSMERGLRFGDWWAP